MKLFGTGLMLLDVLWEGQTVVALLCLPLLSISPSVSLHPPTLSIVPSPPAPLQPPQDFMILFNDRWAALESKFSAARNLSFDGSWSLILCVWTSHYVCVCNVLTECGLGQAPSFVLCWKCLCQAGHRRCDMINNRVCCACIRKSYVKATCQQVTKICIQINTHRVWKPDKCSYSLSSLKVSSKSLNQIKIVLKVWWEMSNKWVINMYFLFSRRAMHCMLLVRITVLQQKMKGAWHSEAKCERCHMMVFNLSSTSSVRKSPAHVGIWSHDHINIAQPTQQEVTISLHEEYQALFISIRNDLFHM